MITQKLVQPSYKCIRFADRLNLIPLSLNLSTGRISYEDKPVRKLMSQVIYYLALLKCFQILWALVQLLWDFSPEKVPVIILTGLWFVLSFNSFFWSYELFHRGTTETIIVFNSLVFQTDDKVVGSEDILLKLKKLLKQLLSLGLQELLCVLTPFAVKMFVPLYLLLMLAFPHWKVFSTCFVHERKGVDWTWSSGIFVSFELCTALSTEANFLFLLFLQLALQVTHITRMKATAQKHR